MKLLFVILILLSITSCKSENQKAFEEWDARDYIFNAFDIDTIGSWKEVELLTNASIHRPDLLAIIEYRAEEYELLKEWEKAKVDYEFLIQKDWVSSSLYRRKAVCELKLKYYYLAMQDLKEAERHCIKEWENTPQFIKSMSHWGSEEERFELKLQSIKEELESIQQLIQVETKID